MTTDQKLRALRAQIRAKKSITFVYDKDKSGTRTGNPHTLGTANDKYAVRLYQTGGKSASGLVGNDSPEDFRFFYLEDIDKIEELSDTFKVNPAFQRNDEAFDKIDIQVSKK